MWHNNESLQLHQSNKIVNPIESGGVVTLNDHIMDKYLYSNPVNLTLRRQMCLKMKKMELSKLGYMPM